MNPDLHYGFINVRQLNVYCFVEMIDQWLQPPRHQKNIQSSRSADNQALVGYIPSCIPKGSHK